MKGTISVFNSGSSSIKFSLFLCDPDTPAKLQLLYDGQVDGIGSRPRFKAINSKGETVEGHQWESEGVEKQPDQKYFINFIIGWIREHRLALGLELLGVGHRVVHGGNIYSNPVIIDSEILETLETFTPLAPLHQPYNLSVISNLIEIGVDVPQIACFDTAFHQTNPSEAVTYAIPEELRAKGIRRYGFHGLSYEYIAGHFRRIAPDEADGRTIVAHLGSGSSMCAVKNGRSIASSMGFSAMDGLIMSTRPGSLDPGILLYLMEKENMSIAELTDLLYKKCGLLGLSGISKDMRELIGSADPKAKMAIDIYLYRINRELGSLAAALGGVDSLIFTAGIGENSDEIRRRICLASKWLGLDLDETANARGDMKISQPGSKVSIWAMPTNEELMIAMHTRDLLMQQK